MDLQKPPHPKPPFKFSSEKVALMLGGSVIGVLAIVFGLKLATPLVKRACQSILEAPDAGGQHARFASVEAVVIKPGTISRRITTVGKLRANESVTLRTEMQGRIKEIAFKEGSQVKQGDVLIRFEDEEAKAQVVKAEADIEFRQARYDRMTLLQSKGLTKAPELDQERGGLNMAKAELEVAKAKLAKTVIFAPFEGKIGLIDVSVGAFVDSQKELVTLVDFDPMKIDFKIPEKYIHDIGPGQSAEIKLDSFPNEIFHATVEAIDSRVDPQTHSIAVRATIPNEDEKLQTGLFGRVGVIIGVKNDALLLPESALGREGDIEYVWAVTNGKAGRKRVLTGTRENGQVEITAGLRADEIIVTSGQLKLGEGMAVKISNMGDDTVELPNEEETSERPQNTKKTAENPKASDNSSTSSTSSDSQETPKVETAEVETAKESSETTTEATPSTTQKVDEHPATDILTSGTKGADKTATPDASKPAETPATDTLTSGTTEADKTATPDASKPAETPATDTLTSGTKEADKTATPDASKPAETSEENPKEDALHGKVKMKLREEPVQNSTAPEVEKSLFTKARDFITNLFKRS